MCVGQHMLFLNPGDPSASNPCFLVTESHPRRYAIADTASFLYMPLRDKVLANGVRTDVPYSIIQLFIVI